MCDMMSSGKNSVVNAELVQSSLVTGSKYEWAADSVLIDKIVKAVT